MEEIESQRNLQSGPVQLVSTALVIPTQLVTIDQDVNEQASAEGRKEIEEIAVKAVMELESRMGFIPRDVGAQKEGYDIISVDPENDKQRFIEVKGRRAGGATLTLTKNEINYSRNDPENYIWGLVRVDGDDVEVRYLRHLFEGIKDDAMHKTYPFNNYWKKAGEPS